MLPLIIINNADSIWQVAAMARELIQSRLSQNVKHRQGGIAVTESCAGRGVSRSKRAAAAALACNWFSDQASHRPETWEGQRQDGPDYVDNWMSRNLEAVLVDFIRRCCTSFVRWNLLRQLHADRRWTTPETAARAIGANHVTISRELESLASLGVVYRRRRGRPAYRLAQGSALADALEVAVRAYDSSREFRFTLVYSIVRATHMDAVLD